jgi:hypothetical protein
MKSKIHQLIILAVGAMALSAQNLFSDSRVACLANSGTGDGNHAGPNHTRLLEEAFASRYLLAKKGTADNEVGVCDATDRPVFVMTDEGAIGDYVNGQLLHGSTTVTASKAIAVEDPVHTTENGKVTDTAVDGCYFLGYALTAAAEDGDFLEIDANPKLDAESV